MNNKPSSFNELKDLLTQLSNFEPYRSSKFFIREQRTVERIANWMLIIGVMLMLLIVLLALCDHLSSSPARYTKIAASWIAVGAQAFGLLSVVVRSFGVLLLATKWKRITLTTLLREVEVDEDHAHNIRRFSKNVMSLAERHLRLKLSRLEKRAGAVLGDKTAVISLIALTMPVLNEAGGMAWIQRVIGPNSSLTSWESISFYFFAFLLGLSVGAIGLKMLAERFRYQLEILSLAE